MPTFAHDRPRLGPQLKPPPHELLSAAATEYDRNRHLVVELKAPDLVVSMAEKDQIESYAQTVATYSRFVDSNTQWDFWLVTTDMDDPVTQRANQKDRPRGLLFEPDIPNSPHVRVRVWVRTWSEILEDARRRLSYFQDKLQHDPSLEPRSTDDLGVMAAS